MQEAPTPPTVPSGFLNRATHAAMVISTIGGGLLAFLVCIGSWEALRYSTITFTTGSRETYNEHTVHFDGPGKPWLCLAAIILSAAFLTYIPLLVQIIKRKKRSIASSNLTAILMTVGGLCFFAGADINSGQFLIGILPMTYAGLGYLAYNRWNRVRSQLCRD